MLKLFSVYGRAKRAEYWGVQILYAILLIPLSISERMPANTPMADTEFFWVVLACFGFWLWLAVTIRRLRDIKISRWYMLLLLIPIVNFIVWIVWGCIPSKK